MATVILADDHALVRVGLRRVLESVGHQVLDEVEDGLLVVPAVEREHPDVLLLDLGLPGLHGLDVLLEVTRRVPSTKVLVVSAYNRDEFVSAALRTGAAGYVLKGAQADELLDAVAEVSRGAYYVSPQLSDSLERTGAVGLETVDDPYEALSTRERQVFLLMAEGLLNHQVGVQLCISPRTVETHRAHIMKKLGLKTQTDVVLYALRRGLMSLDDAAGAPRLDVF
ncbi:MAG TPA: response regulator transcription factor [Vicinamibacterales bacterium]|nr:response regulator transcription factor [Vicinamibacterales bacterium]